MGQQLNEILKTYAFVQLADHSSATDIGWVAAKEFDRFMVVTTAIALTGTGLSAAGAFKILGNTQANGGGTDVTLATHATVTPDAVADMLVLEVALPDLVDGEPILGVSANLTAQNAGDDHHVLYILGGARYPVADLAADIIA